MHSTNKREIASEACAGCETSEAIVVYETYSVTMSEMPVEKHSRTAPVGLAAKICFFNRLICQQLGCFAIEHNSAGLENITSAGNLSAIRAFCSTSSMFVPEALSSCIISKSAEPVVGASPIDGSTTIISLGLCHHCGPNRKYLLFAARERSRNLAAPLLQVREAAVYIFNGGGDIIRLCNIAAHLLRFSSTGKTLKNTAPLRHMRYAHAKEFIRFDV